MVSFSFFFWLLVSTLPHLTFAHYKLLQDYTGSRFFSNFDFYNGQDPSNGHVRYVGESTANLTRLAGTAMLNVANSSQEVVYLGVDGVSTLPVTEGRSSVRVESVQAFNRSLVVADILHMPSNECGVWPAFWMMGTSGTWPDSGEIDILEGTNDQAYNRMSLHSTPGIKVNLNNGSMIGKQATLDCDVNAMGQDKNAGCMVNDQPSSKGYGKEFNKQNGGVYAMEMTNETVRLWFFPRKSVPADIDAGTPSPPLHDGSDMHNWGKPTALFRLSNTTTDDHFYNMKLIFNTNFCGDWAGKVWNTTASCAKLAPTCEQYVSQNPQAFNESFWLINSVKVFQKDKDAAKAVNSTRSTLHRRRASHEKYKLYPSTRVVPPTPTATSITASANFKRDAKTAYESILADLGTLKLYVGNIMKSKPQPSTATLNGVVFAAGPTVNAFDPVSAIPPSGYSYVYKRDLTA